MKKTFLIFVSFISITMYGGNNDSLQIVSLQREVSNMKSSISKLQQEAGRFKILYQQQEKELDSMQVCQQQQAENINTLADKVGADISNTNQKIDNNVNTLSKSIKNRTWLGVFGILTALVMFTLSARRIRIGSKSYARRVDKAG